MGCPLVAGTGAKVTVITPGVAVIVGVEVACSEPN